jgi:hypothetical protein
LGGGLSIYPARVTPEDEMNGGPLLSSPVRGGAHGGGTHYANWFLPRGHLWPRGRLGGGLRRIWDRQPHCRVGYRLTNCIIASG